MRVPTARLLASLAALTMVSSTATAAVTSGNETAAAPAAVTHDVTSPEEAARVDRVPVDGLVWKDCKDLPAQFQCADFDVPMDYDKPDGTKYTLNIMKRIANNGDAKKGSLFLNPGGPGASSVRMIPATDRFISPQVLDDFDMIGVDPRGIGGSHIADCFKGDMDAYGKIAEEVGKYDYAHSTLESMRGALANKAMADACNDNGNEILRHMSTAEVARDMDVVRRAVGDDKLTYLGFSYGTYLGAMYGNMFPDRVRAIVNDGVINPADWAGTNRNNQNMNQDNRLYSAIAAEKAMHESFKRCEEVGHEVCDLAKNGDDDITAAEKFTAVMKHVSKTPVNLTLPPGIEVTLTDGDIAGSILSSLYRQDGAVDVTYLVNLVWKAINNEDAPETDSPAARNVINTLKLATATGPRSGDESKHDGAALYLGVACSDGRHPRSISENARRAYDARHMAPVIGQVWAWGSVPCSPDAWKNQDANSYYGKFGKTTSNGMLFVGALWDPATAHEQAVSAAKSHPGSSLISVNNWGHTSYGASPCATIAIDEYIINLKQPGTLVCKDAAQPFIYSDAPRMAQADRTEFVVPFKPFQLYIKGM